MLPPVTQLWSTVRGTTRPERMVSEVRKGAGVGTSGSATAVGWRQLTTNSRQLTADRPSDQRHAAV